MPRKRSLLLTALALCALTLLSPGADRSGMAGAAGSPGLPELPTSLPFEFTRQDIGPPVPQEEITAFTNRIVAAWRDARVFDYLASVTYGMKRDNDRGMPYYSVFWSGVTPYKEGGRVIFRHMHGGSAENIMIPNPVLLTNVIAAYLFSGDERLARLADELARGVSATLMGSVWDESVPQEDRAVMARSVVNNNYEGLLEDGRPYAVDYSAWRIRDIRRWNTWFMNVPHNPYWGDIYIQNMRSKDDICHLFRAAGLLPHFMDRFEDPAVRAGVRAAYFDLEAFARDVVDHGFRIRSVDLDGTLFIPGIDLASLVFYGPQAECNATLAAQIYAYGHPGDIDCGIGRVWWYDVIANLENKYNYEIIRNFHMAALLHSMNYGHDQVAYNLMVGLANRSLADYNRINDPFDNEDQWEDYKGKLAGSMVKYAACGLPLLAREVRFIHETYDQAIEVWNAYEHWDLWADNVQDGPRPYKPGTRVAFQDMTAFLQLCASPYANDTGTKVVDCEIIRDPSSWGY